jgi:hypothetical protein
MPREEIISGDDENIVGALTTALMNRMPMRSTGMPARGGTVSAPRFSTANLQNQVGGTQDNKLRAPLGLGSHVFVDNGPFSFIVEPQEAFRGERLIVDVVAATGLLLSIDEILVGSLPQTPSTEFGLPAVMFRADATDAQMDWQICPAGTKIIIKTHVVGTFAEADELTAQLGLYGVWIRG